MPVHCSAASFANVSRSDSWTPAARRGVEQARCRAKFGELRRELSTRIPVRRTASRHGEQIAIELLDDRGVPTDHVRKQDGQRDAVRDVVASR